MIIFFQCRSTLWAVLLSLLCVTVAKPYYEDEGEFFDFFQDDESVIQDEADFQYMNEAQENTNKEFAEEMEDSKEHMKNDAKIQNYQNYLKGGLPLFNLRESSLENSPRELVPAHVSTFISRLCIVIFNLICSFVI